jgi:hypothetical protein
MFACLAIFFVILAFSGVPTKTFGRRRPKERFER